MAFIVALSKRMIQLRGKSGIIRPNSNSYRLFSSAVDGHSNPQKDPSRTGFRVLSLGLTVFLTYRIAVDCFESYPKFKELIRLRAKILLLKAYDGQLDEKLIDQHLDYYLSSKEEDGASITIRFGTGK